MTVLLVFTDAVAQKHTTTQSIKKQQQFTQQEIKETNKKIQSNIAETTKSLNRLNLIEAEIAIQEKTIKTIGDELNTINRKMTLINDSIKITERQIEKLKKEYSKAVSRIQANSSPLDRMMFIFSAKDFNQAYRRMRYMQQFSKWREQQTIEIQQQRSRCQEKQ